MIETWIIRPDGRFRDFSELPMLAFNESGVAAVQKHLNGVRPAFVYQRYSLNNFTGLLVAQRMSIPFVLEYNGSELWILEQWGGRRLRNATLAREIEDTNLQRADLVVVVSEVMGMELRGRGVNPARVLVNPNGVDVDHYSPTVSGSEVRRRLALQDKLVIGFIGTFGPWHGAELLAEAFCQLLDRDPRRRDQVRLLMIGDGDRYAATRAIVEKGGADDATIFVGRTHQADGPAHLAACDVLASPHVPNADGSRFFGSPTKLFEYMAMSKGIVASRLEQIGEILEHDRTALLVEPGNVDDLVDGLATLLDDPGRRSRLGDAAREEVVAKYTWREHTRRIVDRLQDLTGAA